MEKRSIFFQVINSHSIGMRNRKMLLYQFIFSDILNYLKICKGPESSQQVLSVPDLFMDFGKHILQNKDESSAPLDAKGDLSKVNCCYACYFSYIIIFPLSFSLFSISLSCLTHTHFLFF